MIWIYIFQFDVIETKIDIWSSVSRVTNRCRWRAKKSPVKYINKYKQAKITHKPIYSYSWCHCSCPSKPEKVLNRHITFCFYILFYFRFWFRIEIFSFFSPYITLFVVLFGIFLLVGVSNCLIKSPQLKSNLIHCRNIKKSKNALNKTKQKKWERKIKHIIGIWKESEWVEEKKKNTQNTKRLAIFFLMFSS